jgi:hypothetical protein
MGENGDDGAGSETHFLKCDFDTDCDMLGAAYVCVSGICQSDEGQGGGAPAGAGGSGGGNSVMTGGSGGQDVISAGGNSNLPPQGSGGETASGGRSPGSGGAGGTDPGQAGGAVAMGGSMGGGGVEIGGAAMGGEPMGGTGTGGGGTGTSMVSQAPQKLLLVHLFHGFLETAFWPEQNGEGLTLSPILSPLELYKDRILAVRGLDSHPVYENRANDKGSGTYGATAFSVTQDISADQAGSERFSLTPSMISLTGTPTIAEVLNTRRQKAWTRAQFSIHNGSLESARGMMFRDEQDSFDRQRETIAALFDANPANPSLSFFNKAMSSVRPTIQAGMYTMGAAFAANHTDVALLDLPQYTLGVDIPNGPENFGTFHQQTIHKLSLRNRNDPSRPDESGAIAVQTATIRVLADLIVEIHQTPYLDGRLEDVLSIVIFSSLSNFSARDETDPHTMGNIPMIVIPSKFSKLRRGLVYSVPPRDTSNIENQSNTPLDRPLIDFWVTLAKANGFDLSGFGNPELKPQSIDPLLIQN